MSYIIEYGEYTLINSKDLSSRSCSCIGNFKVDRKPKPKHELDDEIKRIRSEYIEPVHKKMLSGKLETIPLAKKERVFMPNQGEDYGPQRFCKCCNVKLEERWDSAADANVYVHPTVNCKFIKVESENDAGNKITYYQSRELDISEMTSGTTKRDRMTMDDLRNVYAKLDNEGLEWMRNNKEYLRKLYIDHADDAGKSELEVKPASYEDSDGNVIDPLENSDKSLADADSEIFNRTEYSKQEINFINYLVGGSYGKRGMILRSPKKALAKLEETPMRSSLKEYYKEILEFIIARGHKHPEVCRWICRTNGWDIRSSFNLKPVSEEKKQKNYRVRKNSNNVNSYPMEDYELESRKMLAYVTNY